MKKLPWLFLQVSTAQMPLKKWKSYSMMKNVNKSMIIFLSSHYLKKEAINATFIARMRRIQLIVIDTFGNIGPT